VAAQEHSQLGLREGLSLVAGDSSPSARRTSSVRPLEDPDQRVGQNEEAAHRSRDPECYPLGVAQRHGLWHELTDDDVQVGDDEKRDHHGQHGRQIGVERMRQRLFAESTDTEACQRDAELHRGDEPRRVGDDLPHGAGPRLP